MKLFIFIIFKIIHIYYFWNYSYLLFLKLFIFIIYEIIHNYHL